MHNEFTAIIEKDENFYIAYCAEIPGANGQGKTKEDCLKNLSEAIELILEDRRQNSFRGINDEAISDHSLWCNPLTGKVETVPRHTEIPNKLAQKICKGLSVKY